MAGRRTLQVLGAALALCAQAASAQGIITLICSGTPNGAADYYLVINYDRALVSSSANPTAYSARISLSQIEWESTREELPNGEVRFAARHTLDRATGTLRTQLQCLPHASSFCGPESIDYCRPGLRR